VRFGFESENLVPRASALLRNVGQQLWRMRSPPPDQGPPAPPAIWLAGRPTTPPKPPRQTGVPRGANFRSRPLPTLGHRWTPGAGPRKSLRRKLKVVWSPPEDFQRRHDIFVADELEDANGCFMPTNQPWNMWQAHCAARREMAGSQCAFSRQLAKNFTHDHNHGRPRFLNVRAKQKAPKLSVVRSSG
jgi:hypothetical protein